MKSYLALLVRIEELEHEIRMLRRYGDEDAVAWADAAIQASHHTWIKIEGVPETYPLRRCIRCHQVDVPDVSKLCKG